MPEMDGLTATRQIYQEWPPGQRPRIIAMTGATQSNWEQCLEAGMDDYISKPIQIANHLALSRVMDLGSRGAESRRNSNSPLLSAL